MSTSILPTTKSSTESDPSQQPSRPQYGLSSSSSSSPPSSPLSSLSPLSRQDYYHVLVEFFYKHLDFHMAELESILDLYGIQLGSSQCQIVSLPSWSSSSSTDDGGQSNKSKQKQQPGGGGEEKRQNHLLEDNKNNGNNNNNNNEIPNEGCIENPTTSSSKIPSDRKGQRPFVILAFPIDEVDRLLCTTSREKSTTRTKSESSTSTSPSSASSSSFDFEPFIDVQMPPSSSSSSSEQEETKSSFSKNNKNNNNNDNNGLPWIAEILSKCVLVKSVVELWSCSNTLDGCASDAYQWLLQTNDTKTQTKVSSFHTNLRTKLSFHDDKSAPPPKSSTSSSTPSSWKMTVHTLGQKFTFEEQNIMRKQFRNILDNMVGPVQLTNPDVEFLLIHEIELDYKGSPYHKPTITTTTATKSSCDTDNTETTLTNEVNNDRNDDDNNSHQDPQQPSSEQQQPVTYYFGRVLGGGKVSRNIYNRYTLKNRPYLGPTSMDAELSFVMTSLGQIRKGSVVYDPFVGTGSILLSSALRGAYCMGSDIDLMVLRGKGGDQTIWTNFERYGLPRPDIVRSDNSLYHRHFQHHHSHHDTRSCLYDTIICDPPYGIRAGAKQSGSKFDNPRPMLDENRHDHIAQTKPYAVSDVMSDLLDVAARTLNMNGRLVYIIPSFCDFDPKTDLPRHDCLELIHACYQPFSPQLGRTIVAMKKTRRYDISQRQHYLQTIWVNGPASAEKCINIREKLMEAAKLKPGYEEKAAMRKQKRRAHREAKKLEKQQQRQEQQNKKMKLSEAEEG